MADETPQSTATATATKPAPARPRVDRLPQYNVLLHNDDENAPMYVVESIVMLVAMDPRMAMMRMLEAHTEGMSLIVTTHREHAELLCEQFTSRRLTVTMEPAC